MNSNSLYDRLGAPPGLNVARGAVLQDRAFWRYALFATLSVLLAAFWFGKQVRQADWGIIDDHEVFEYLGTARHLSLTDVVSTIWVHTEVGDPWSNVRFRPVYYFFRVVEVALWGDHVAMWYATRVLLYATFLFAVICVVSRLCGFFLALTVAAYTSTFGFWGDVFGRLGPAEAYATAGLGIWLIGIFGVLAPRQPGRARLALLAVTVGTMILSGSKETLVPFAAYSIAAILISFYRNGATERVASILAIAVCLVWGTLITIIMLHQLRAHGTDVYGASVAFSDRARLIAGAVRPLLIPALVTILLISAFSYVAPRHQWRPASVWLLVTLAVLGSLYASQFIAYNGRWPTTTRYDFPGQLCLPAMWVAIVAFVGTLDAGRRNMLRVRQTGLLLCLLLIQSRLITGQDAINPGMITARVASNIAATRQFSSGLRDVVAEARAYPNTPIILDAYGSDSYEPVFSTSLYLAHDGLRNPLSVRFHRQAADLLEKPQAQLAAAMDDLERNGALNKYGRFIPLANESDAARQRCISVALLGEPDATCFARKVF